MKKTVKALAVLLAICFCFSALVVMVGAAASDVEKGGTFYFGTYPQKHVTDAELIEKLDAEQKKTKQDVVKLGGETYYMLRAEKNSKPGGGPYGIMYGYGPGVNYWFRVEPIAWRVLDSGAGGVLLMSEYVLCTHVFNETVRADNTWENSDVRAWLNDTFLKTAFTANEQAFLLNSSLTNEDNPVHGTYNGVPSAYAGDFSGGYPYCGTESGNDTVDKIFLPSFNEITNPDYGFNIGWKDKKGEFGQPVGYYETDTEPGEHSGRSTSATDYAKCQGIWANLTSENGYPVPTCRYWLRTAGYDSTCAAAVLEDGRVSTGWDVSYNIVGIRPFMRVTPNAVSDSKPIDPEPENMPFHIIPPATEFHYKQSDVQFKADTEVKWASSNPRIASIDPDTGVLTIHRVGTVTIYATSVETGDTVEFQMEITYLWWQMLIRIFLFGWAWY